MFPLPQALLPSSLEYIISGNLSDIKSLEGEKREGEGQREREGENQGGKEGKPVSNKKKKYNIKTGG